MPVSHSPRPCIAMGLALTEAQLALVTMAQRYRPGELCGRSVEPEPLLTLRARGGLPMRVRNREARPVCRR